MRAKIQANPLTAVDVETLMQVFPDILPDGRRVTHEQIESVLKISRISSRYRTVVRKWRRRLFTERRIFLDGRAADGAGFVSLSPDEMVRYGNREVRAAGRKLKGAFAVVSLPNDAELSVDTLRYRNLLSMAIEKIVLEHKSSLRDVSKSLTPTRQLPRLKPAVNE